MGKYFTKFKTDLVLQSIAMIIIGIVLMFFPGATQNAIAYAISIVLVVCGVIKIINYFRAPSRTIGGFNEYSSPVELISGILMIVLAALITKVLISIIPVVLGFFVLYSGLIKLDQAIQLIRSKQGGYIVVLVMSIVTMIIGVIAIFHPAAINNILIQIIGAGLTFGGVTDLISTGYISRKFKHLRDDDINDI